MEVVNKGQYRVKHFIKRNTKTRLLSTYGKTREYQNNKEGQEDRRVKLLSTSLRT
jgi:hypothetical protein